MISWMTKIKGVLLNNPRKVNSHCGHGNDKNGSEDWQDDFCMTINVLFQSRATADNDIQQTNVIAEITCIDNVE